MKRLLILALLLFSLCIAVNAAQQATLPSGNVHLSDELVDNEYREYPLLLYKDITYFPLTYYDCRYLGLVTEWSNSTKTLSVYKDDKITGAYRDYKGDRKNQTINDVEMCAFNIFVNGKQIDNEKEEYPLITFRGVTYFPLTWRFAVEEFGWSYNYDAEYGLVINSTNRPMVRLELPDMRKNNPSAATDGGYYYYTGTENRIFRVPCYDFSQREVIHTLEYTYYPDTTPVDFSYSDGNLYMSYRVGGATMGTSYRYKINSDGTLEKSDEGTHYTSGVGFNGYVIDGDGFTVERFNSGRVGTTAVYYKHDDTEARIEIKKDGIIFGEYKDISMNLNKDGQLLGGNDYGNVWFNDPQVLGKAIYLTGYEENGNKNSDLYRVDVTTGNVEKILENVAVFHTFYGWDNDKRAMSEMVLYERQSNNVNTLYRYSYLSKMMYYITGFVPRMRLASGDNNLVVVLDDGKNTSLYCFDGYGTGSLETKVFESNKGFEFYVDNGLVIGTSYYSDDIKSVFLSDYWNFIKTSELPTNICVGGNAVVMTIPNEDNTDSFVVRMELE